MTYIGKKQSEVVSKLVSFFNKVGIESVTVEDKKQITINVYDRRSENLFISYLMKLTDQGTKIQIDSFHVVTPKLQYVLSDNRIEMFIISQVSNRALFSLTWKTRIPSMLQIDRHLLRELVKEPVTFLINLKLPEHGYIQPSFLKVIKDYENDYVFPLTDDDERAIKTTVDELGRQALNSMVQM